MANLARMKEIQARFADRATFLTIYTQESHPADSGDFVDNAFSINQHKNLEERLIAADQLRQLTSGPFLIDNMKNEASDIYGSFPERLYIILNNKIVYQGGMGPMGYKPEEIESWLDNFYK